MRLYLDANTLIEAVEGVGSTRELLASIFGSVVTRNTELLTSELTLAETIVGPLKALRISPDDEAAVGFLSSYIGLFEDDAALRPIALGLPILLKAARLRARHDALKLPDAIHLATTAQSGCHVFVSGDRKLRAQADREGITTCSLAPSDLDALLARIADAR
ncbi:type II toxin-antitoxin system VapC family toxin [Hansschlegelia sp. KR7-227]|uniref:type II toxin-antitoxin system VapC family toxin n=1 Tax=Hansschlegelia sp. KR7-227 TaxID=3400914 RepID=UPI003C10D122